MRTRDNWPQAIDEYTGLLAKVMDTKPEVETDLKEAVNLSLLFEGLARLHRITRWNGRGGGARRAAAGALAALEPQAAEQRFRRQAARVASSRS